MYPSSTRQIGRIFIWATSFFRSLAIFLSSRRWTTNPVSVSQAKIYVEPVPEYQGASEVADSLDFFCKTFGNYVSDYSVTEDSDAGVAQMYAIQTASF